MIYRIYPQKDTFITNKIVNGVQQTGSNAGASETLSVFKQAGISGAIGTYGSASLAHALVKFDMTQFMGITGSAVGINYHLVMRNAQTCTTLPFSYDMEVAPLTQDWDEGRGIDVDFFSDSGYANWVRPKQTTTWATAGGDTTAPYLPYHFDQGNEDLDLDVTTIVNMWLSGTITNNGLLVRVSSTLETDNNDYYIKKFFGKTTNFLDRRPYIEARWDESVKDDRNNFVFDYPNNIYLYNHVRGALTDLSVSAVFVRIVDASGTIATATASHVSTGIYSASLTINTGSYSGSIFNDMWFSGSNWFSGSKTFMTGTIYPNGQFEVQDIHQDEYFVSIDGLKPQYTIDEVVRLQLYTTADVYAPTVVLSASSDERGQVVTKAYYQVVNDRTDDIVVPFGTGTVETTRLSYDDRGNYFKFYMSTLSPGNVYRLVFLFDVDGQRQIIDRNIKFRVV